MRTGSQLEGVGQNVVINCTGIVLDDAVILGCATINCDANQVLGTITLTNAKVDLVSAGCGNSELEGLAVANTHLIVVHGNGHRLSRGFGGFGLGSFGLGGCLDQSQNDGLKVQVLVRRVGNGNGMRTGSQLEGVGQNVVINCTGIVLDDAVILGCATINCDANQVLGTITLTNAKVDLVSAGCGNSKLKGLAAANAHLIAVHRDSHRLSCRLGLLSGRSCAPSAIRVSPTSNGIAGIAVSGNLQIAGLIPLAIPAQDSGRRVHTAEDHIGITSGRFHLVDAVGIRISALSPYFALARFEEIGREPGTIHIPGAGVQIQSSTLSRLSGNGDAGKETAEHCCNEQQGQ